MTNYSHLSYEDRKNIEDGLNENKSINQIAKELCRNHSTILREIDRDKKNILNHQLGIIIQEINGKIIKEDGISISFQKQNGSFVFAAKNSINEILKEQIPDIVNNSSNAELFATYNFSDMKEFNVYHYIYDNNILWCYGCDISYSGEVQQDYRGACNKC